jgi:hypothetical protein
MPVSTKKFRSLFSFRFDSVSTVLLLISHNIISFTPVQRSMCDLLHQISFICRCSADNFFCYIFVADFRPSVCLHHYILFADLLFLRLNFCWFCHTNVSLVQYSPFTTPLPIFLTFLTMFYRHFSADRYDKMTGLHKQSHYLAFTYVCTCSFRLHIS